MHSNAQTWVSKYGKIIQIWKSDFKNEVLNVSVSHTHYLKIFQH